VVANARNLYTLTLSNTSLQPVQDVFVQMRMPAELSYHSSTDAEPNAARCGSTCVDHFEAGWTLGTLAAGESRTISVNALVGNVLSGNLITFPVRVSATGMTDIMNQLKTVAVNNTPSADLALGASTDPVIANQSFTYRLDFGNTSAGALSNIELRAYLPEGITVDSISDGGTAVNASEVLWSVAPMGAGAFLSRQVTVTADTAAAGDTLTVLAELTHDGGVDIDAQSEFAVSVSAAAPWLSFSIAATPDPVLSGGALAYSMSVTNDSALPVDGVEVQFRVPDELSFHSVNDTAPDASNCGSTCTPRNEATWSLGTMAAGASQVITINATVASGLVNGTMINVPVRITATNMTDTINLQYTTVIHD
jgi:hypothetical protein